MDISHIREVNSIMFRDYSSHNYNQQWITQNIPLSISGNRYNHLRADAPFYCNSSMGVMLNYYNENEGFINMINHFVSIYHDNATFLDVDLFNISRWVVNQTSISISKEGSDELDLQNVAWWMGIASYIACIISLNFNAQYEKIFIVAWGQYFTNENLLLC